MAGFQLIKTQGSSGYCGKVQTFEIDPGDSNLMAIGDAVIATADANADGVQRVIAATGTTAHEVTGIICGFEPNLSNLELKGRTASTARLSQIQVDPNALYHIEIGSALDVNDVGTNVLLTATVATASGNLVRSNMVTGVNDAAGALRVVGLVPPTDGTAIGAVGNLAIVSIIRSQLTNLTGV